MSSTGEPSLEAKLNASKDDAGSPSTAQAPRTELVPFARRFPWEVLLLIFAAADVPTLAAIGRVSYDVLVCTSSLLYRDVQLTSLDALKLLFCLRHDDVIPISQTTGIYSYLSLSQIKTLSLNLTSFSALEGTEHGPVDELGLSLSRMLGFYRRTLELDTFRFVFPNSRRNLASQVLRQVRPLLNPTRMEYEASGRPVDDPIKYTDLLPPLLKIDWNRIDVVDMKGQLVLWMDRSGPTSRTEIAYSNPRSIQLRLHVATLLIGGELSKLLREVDDRPWGFDALKPGHLVLVVRTEVEKKQVELGVQGLNAARRALISVELEL